MADDCFVDHASYFRQIQQMIKQVAEFRFGQVFQLWDAVFNKSHTGTEMMGSFVSFAFGEITDAVVNTGVFVGNLVVLFFKIDFFGFQFFDGFVQMIPPCDVIWVKTKKDTNTNVRCPGVQIDVLWCLWYLIQFDAEVSPHFYYTALLRDCQGLYRTASVRQEIDAGRRKREPLVRSETTQK